ncbi:unnamed protein product [Toxocara canis]|uniref:ANF_receptor domain-containing protein n=1 Tax=Toxocara canis TaxID=6265 RepID=A0A183V2K3_TOXCA|nr:unnamed protein product [Toxocara canis]
MHDPTWLTSIILLVTTTCMRTVSMGKVRVGHIGAMNAMPNSDKILDISRKELLKDGILDEDFDLEFDILLPGIIFGIINQMGCGESFEGVAVAADMFYLQKVKAFIGPYCNAELDAVAKMAAYWNIPIVGYMASGTAFVDKNIYKTLARVSLRTTNSLAVALTAVLKHYNWKRVAIATNTGALAFERTTTFEETFQAHGVTVVKKIIFDEYANAKIIADSGLLHELANVARVVVCIFSSTREMSKEFLRAVGNVGLNSNDFVYLLPWLQTEKKDKSPWIGEDGQVLQNIKEIFGNTIIVDDINGFEDTLVMPFKERVEANGLTAEDLDLTNIYGYIHLFDALKLYAMAARRALNETSKPEIVSDGRYIWTKMRRMTFPGAFLLKSAFNMQTAQLACRTTVVVLSTFLVQVNRDTPLKLVEMEPVLLDKCDGLKNRSGCYDLTVTDLVTGFWPSADGRMPPDEPICGYRNERCDYTPIIIAGSAIFACLAAIASACLLHRYCENQALAKTPWRVFRDDMRILTDDEMKSMLSLGSTRTKMSNSGTFAKHTAVVGTNTQASFHAYQQRRPISFCRQDMKMLTQIKQAVHDNLNPFIGMAFNEKEEMLLIWKFCSRGTLQDIIYNHQFILDAQFHGAFARDITLVSFFFLMSNHYPRIH